MNQSSNPIFLVVPTDAVPEVIPQLFPIPEPETTSLVSGGFRWGWWLHRLGLGLAGLYLLLLILSAIQPRWIVSGDPLEANARQAFHSPSWNHFLGTDENGRDVLTRVVYPTRSSMLLASGASIIGLSLGIGTGLASGLGPRFLDAALMRFIDLLLALPEVLLALVIITFWGQGIVNAMIAIGIASVPRYARMVRVQAQVIRQAPFVEAARTMGLRSSTIIWRHVLPNAIKPVVILAAIGFGEKISFGAALSFLGFGTPPPAPEWGAMLSSARNFLANAWWLTAFPAAAITLTVISVTVLGKEFLNRSEGKTT